MSYVDELLDAYRRFVSLPWQQNLAGPQRVWMAVYPPEHERRLRLHLPAFKEATNEHGHSWALVDITTSFERWMADHAYREAYFEEPELLSTALPAFFAHLVDDVRSQLSAHSAPDGVVALLGAGTLFGLGDVRQGLRPAERSQRRHRRPAARLLPGRARRQQLPAARRA